LLHLLRERIAAAEIAREGQQQAPWVLEEVPTPGRRLQHAAAAAHEPQPL